MTFADLVKFTENFICCVVIHSVNLNKLLCTVKNQPGATSLFYTTQKMRFFETNFFSKCKQRKTLALRLSDWTAGILLRQARKRWGGGGGGGGLPSPFSKIGKKCPVLVEKMPWLWSSTGKISHLKWNF